MLAGSDRPVRHLESPSGSGAKQIRRVDRRGKISARSFIVFVQLESIWLSLQQSLQLHANEAVIDTRYQPLC